MNSSPEPDDLRQNPSAWRKAKPVELPPSTPPPTRPPGLPRWLLVLAVVLSVAALFVSFVRFATRYSQQAAIPSTNFVQNALADQSDSPVILHQPVHPPSGAIMTELVTDSIGIVLKSVAPGTFQMGSGASEPGREKDEGPRTQVRINYDFWIGKCEVTQDEYERVMHETPSFFDGERQMKEGVRDFGNVPKRPVENVTWEQASEFCRKLTKQGGERIRSRYEYRLPTEAEWEYCCRAGTTTSFSFGESKESLGDYAWFGKNSGGEPKPVGRKKPNPWGLYDMHGNVMEWCWDWYIPNLPGGSVTNPVGPAGGTWRALRGGGWEDENPEHFRSADRWGRPPTTNGYAYGFRIVLAPTIKSLQK